MSVALESEGGGACLVGVHHHGAGGALGSVGASPANESGLAVGGNSRCVGVIAVGVGASAADAARSLQCNGQYVGVGAEGGGTCLVGHHAHRAGGALGGVWAGPAVERGVLFQRER